MAISKLILNGEVQMDVTSDTVTAGSMLSGTTATKNDGTKATGNIASKSSTDLTVSGATVTAPAGYYANAASKAVATTTHPNPSASITSSTGVVTASHTQGTGYVTGGTTTGTLNLTTQAGKTVTPTETAQTAVASYRWTTGPVSVAAISSTYVGTGITTRSAADMTVAAQSVTAPAGYYSQAFTKAVTTTTHPNPTATIVSSTGVVTATHTQTAGYVTAGNTTGTLNLATQAAQTINTSTADQTIASNRWLTGVQTIKSVTTTNLTAANIAEGVVVKVGDANNASRITQITGTHSGATSYTATISGSGNSSYCYVTYGGTKRYTNGNTFTFKAGDTLTIYCRGNNASVNGDKLTLSSYSYTYTLPIGDITINLSYSSSTSNSIVIYGLIKPTGDLSITASGTHNTYKYSTVTVAAGSAFPPAVTITKAPTIGVNTSGVVTASYSGSSSITPTVTSGYVSQGTAGTISTTGTSTYQLTSKAAATYYPSTADQTVASQRWLVGNQTIKSVTTSNLTAENIAEGVVVKIGDSANASRITQITGTHSGGPTYTVTLEGNYWSGNYITYNNTTYNTNGATFEFTPGNTMHIYVSHIGGVVLYKDGEYIEANQFSINHNYVLPSCDVTVKVYTAIDQDNQEYSCVEINREHLDIVDNGKYEVSEYGYANVNVQGGYTIDEIALHSISGVISGTTSRIKNYAFCYCSNITSINFPNVTSIGTAAFFQCQKLSSINLPQLTSAGGSAFAYCSSLITINLPLLNSVSGSLFYDCSNLTTVSCASASKIWSQAFYRCSNLTTISFPSVDYIAEGAFSQCIGLVSINFPQVTSVANSAFNGCYSLTTINFPLVQSFYASVFYQCCSLISISCPSLKSIGSTTFGNCWALSTISLPAISYIGYYAFTNCYNLLSLYLLGSSIVSLAGTTVFSSTPISNYTASTGGVYGKIYVPASLYNSYLTATYWSYFSSRFISV